LFSTSSAEFCLPPFGTFGVCQYSVAASRKVLLPSRHLRLLPVLAVESIKESGVGHDAGLAASGKAEPAFALM
jgi:hypothetical protein